VPLSAADELAMLRATRGRFALVLQDLPALLDRAGERVPPHVVRLEGELVDGGLVLNSGIVETPSGALTIDSGSLEWGQDAQSLLAGARIDVQGKADFRDLSEVAALVSDDVWCGSARARRPPDRRVDGHHRLRRSRRRIARDRGVSRSATRRCARRSTASSCRSTSCAPAATTARSRRWGRT
jgi:hypothetical protein